MHQVEVWEESIVIPTYPVGEPDPNPMFLEKRVYQGSTGKVYPLPVIDKICDEKVDQTYHAVWLENDYLRIMLLPELGGRVQRAYDKTNGYDFVYYNEVIKPALVGLTGPWISGGIEFNWPQHHRPTTYSPVDYSLCENEDGSKTVLVSEVDRMYGTKGMAKFTLHPDRAYLEITGQLYNRTPFPQTFLWWANPAVPVNDHTFSVFPPDVHAVMDHGKRDSSRFPIATGVYYKHDYGAGVDISRYKNIPVPTSYMAFHSDANFVGGYDEQQEAGVLHIADHHISPGKKQWTWGCGDFGQAWDRNLTDANGPYIELMTGVYTDNQPDFTWLMPYEEKTFTQVFMPYKKVGSVKNASTDWVLGLDVENAGARISVYATSVQPSAIVRLTGAGQVLFEKQLRLSPTEVLCELVPIGDCAEDALFLCVTDEHGTPLLSYRPTKPTVHKQPEPAQAAPAPADVLSLEELLLIGQHLEQYRHATYNPADYYREGLKRDPMDSRLNNAYGLYLMRCGEFEQSEQCFRNAISRLTHRNPNPYDGEPSYHLGLVLRYQHRYAEAFDAFYKATWSNAQQEMAFYELAALCAKQGRSAEALAFVEKSLVKNAHSLKARALKVLLLKQLGMPYSDFLAQSLALDPFDYASRLVGGDGTADAQTLAMMRDNPHTFLCIARDLEQWGCYREAAELLMQCHAAYPMLHYERALCLHELKEDASAALLSASAASSLYCFPNSLEDLAALRFAISENPSDAKAPYYLGNLLYDKKRYADALQLWEKSAVLDESFPTVWRNLALVYFNKQNRAQDALHALQKAHSLAPEDARVLLELDQLMKRTGKTPRERFDFLSARKSTVFLRDDLTTEYITLLNLLDRPEEAYALIMSRHFHPWEGGEGKITAQYTLSLLQLAKQDLQAKRFSEAEQKLQSALVFPHSLGEGKLEGAKDNNLYYTLGCLCEQQGRREEALAYWQKATLGLSVPAGMMYYNDQPADLILYQGLAFEKLGLAQEAKRRYHQLIDYGEKHFFDHVTIEYFAVSLPDLQIFEDDLDARNRAHCQYLIALGSYGMGDRQRAQAAYQEVLKIEPSHMGAHIHLAISDAI
ncbi:MAG: DUF5107 domain-containing protein [Clostridia bacterium]